MTADLSSVTNALQILYSDNLRAAINDLSSPLWDDGSTRIRITPNLFPRARQVYRSFWAAAQRVEDAVGVLRHGLPEPEENPW